LYVHILGRIWLLENTNMSSDKQNTISINKIYQKIRKYSDQKLHVLAKQTGMKNHDQLERNDIVFPLSILLAMKKARERKKGFKFEETADGDPDPRFVEYIKTEMWTFIDPITDAPLLDPVMVSSEVRYERASIEAYLRSSGKHICPKTKQKIESYAYPDMKTRRVIFNILERVGIVMDMDQSLFSNGIIQLWDDPSRDQARNPDKFFGSEIAKRLAKPKYLHVITVLNPKGWCLLWNMTAENLRFNNTLQSKWDKTIHELKWSDETTRIIKNLAADYEKISDPFKLNRLHLEYIHRFRLRDFAMLTKYISDNYVVSYNVAPFSLALWHAFYKCAEFIGPYEDPGYKEYKASHIPSQKCGFYTLKEDTASGPNYFESVKLYD